MSPADVEVRDGDSVELPGVLLTIAYDGHDFSGFARQKHARTVAGELLGALREVDAGLVDLRGASRTDRGVHARAHPVALDPTRPRPLSAWMFGVQRHLPRAISVRSVASVPRGFSPRFAARWKHYRYLLHVATTRDPFLEGRAWRVPELNEEGALGLAAQELALALGTHDFAAFRSAADTRPNTTRTLQALSISRDPGDPTIVRVDVRGPGFMYNMVRILVGTMVDVARGRLAPGAMTRALASGNRRDAGITAPPDGLYLEHVELDVPPGPLFEG